MIQCKHISVVHNGTSILKDVSVSIPKGKLTVILGKNGCGKTTLMNCIARQIPYFGNIILNGADIQGKLLNDLSKELSYLPQGLPCPSLSVQELVGFGRTPYLGLNKKMCQSDIDAITRAFQKTESAHLSDRMLHTLSGGERQKVFLAMTLAQETDVMLLDEPNTFIDAASQIHFISILKNLSQEGKTVVVVLHDLSLAVRFADHIILLDGGQCVFSGKKDKCLKENLIESVFNVTRYVANTHTDQQIFFQ